MTQSRMETGNAQDVSFGSNSIDQPLMVAICMITYNQADYIEEAISSIVEQECQFPIMLYISDDCSTDGTSDICKKLASKYPERITLAIQERNIGMIENARLIYKIGFESGAKYIGLCEGDDFWNDPLKLQKQVDLLEENPNASFCFTKVNVKFETEISDHRYLHMDNYPSEIPLADYLDHYYPIPILTKVFRQSVLRPYWQNEYTWLKSVKYIDNVQHMLDLMKGPALFINEVMATYRVQANSVTRTAPKAEAWHIEEILHTHRHYADMCEPEFRDKYFSIRAAHYEKLIHFHLAHKDLRRVLVTIFRFSFDTYAGSNLFRKARAVLHCLKQHL